MSELEKLQKQLDKVEKQLDKHRTACADLHGNGTMRKARHMRNWDYYAQEKFRLQGLIEDLEKNEVEEKTREHFFCNSCQAMFEEECCC